MHLLKIYMAALCLCIGAACAKKASPPATPSPTAQSNKKNPLADCTLEGFVRETKDTLCPYVIMTLNNQQLLPIELPADMPIKFRKGQRLKFGYAPLLIPAPCKSGTPVRVTCIMEIPSSGKPISNQCIQAKTLKELVWLNTATADQPIYEVTRYKYMEDGWAYYVKGKTNVLYDCVGNIICTAEGKILNDCVKKVNALTEATVIYTR